MSRVHKLSDHFVVGAKLEARLALKTLLNAKNQNAKKIADRINMLNVLNSHDEVGTNITCDNKMCVDNDRCCMHSTNACVCMLVYF